MIEKTYRAKRHDATRAKQKLNKAEVHHPKQKLEQIQAALEGKEGLSIVEFFAGRGNLTSEYAKYGNVLALDRHWLNTGDSYLYLHKLIHERQKFNVIDLDPYGFPNRFFPDVFLLIENGYMFITMPKPFVNILNGITAQHLTCYFGESNPPLEVILEKIRLFGLCHWRKVNFLNVQDLGKLWRISCSVNKVKATEFTGVRNQPYEAATPAVRQSSLFD